MSQATRRNITFSMLDAIAPQRQRFTVITSEAPARSGTMAAIDKAAAELAAKGPLFPLHAKEAPLPGVTHYGRIYDQPAYTAAVIARNAARREGGAK